MPKIVKKRSSSFSRKEQSEDGVEKRICFENGQDDDGTTIPELRLPIPKIVERRSSSFDWNKKSNRKKEKNGRSFENRHKSNMASESDLAELRRKTRETRMSIDVSGKENRNSYECFREGNDLSSRNESSSADEMKRKHRSNVRNSKSNGTIKCRNCGNAIGPSYTSETSEDSTTGMTKTIKKIVGHFRR